MNATQSYIFGSYKARILPDGSIRYYREILTPDGRELIGTEYPDEGYCWLNLTRAAMMAGLTDEDTFDAGQATADRPYNNACSAAELADLEQAA